MFVLPKGPPKMHVVASRLRPEQMYLEQQVFSRIELYSTSYGLWQSASFQFFDIR